MAEVKTKKEIQPIRIVMAERAPEIRVLDFKEVPVGYSDEQAISEAGRCLGCKNRPCRGGCPVGIDCGGFVEKIAQGDFYGAVKLVKEKNLLPAVTGRVCPQTEQCEGACLVGKKGEAVGIGGLERFVADYEMKHGVVLPDKAEPTGRSVAVVGSGPSGLTVAADLIQLGHEVVIYEALHEPGGVLIYGIPEFRMPKRIVAAQIDDLKKLGVQIKLNHVIGKTFTIDDLLQIHDAVFLGVGAGAPVFLNIPGENLIGVYSANEYLTRSNLMRAYDFPRWDTPLNVGKKVAVIGGGNVAMDASRTALRLGAEKVYMIYRRTRTEMPARAEEVRHTLEEGVELLELRNPTRILGDQESRVEAIVLNHMRLGEADKSGRRRPQPVPDSEHSLEVDTVVIAIGQKPNPLVTAATLDLQMDKYGYIKIDHYTMATSKEGVYAGGDIAGWGANVIRAMGDGRKAAKSIHDYIMSIGLAGNAVANR